MPLRSPYLVKAYSPNTKSTAAPSAFNWITIERCRELAPGIPTGFLTIAGIAPSAALVYAKSHGHDYVLPSVTSLVPAGQGFAGASRLSRAAGSATARARPAPRAGRPEPRLD